MIFLLDCLFLLLVYWSIIARCYFLQLLMLSLGVKSPSITFTIFYLLLTDLFLNFLSFWLQLQHLNGFSQLRKDRLSKVKVLRLAPQKWIQQDRFILHNAIIPNPKLISRKQGQFINISSHSQISSLSNFLHSQRLTYRYLNPFFYWSKSQ